MAVSVAKSARWKHLKGDDRECYGAAGAGGVRGVRPRYEPRLRRALVASFGPVEGRAATVDALSWAWEHWDRIDSAGNKLGYLYRVGRTRLGAMRRGPVWPE